MMDGERPDAATAWLVNSPLLLALGIVLFGGMLTLAWVANHPGGASGPAADLSASLPARLQTYLTATLWQWELTGRLPTDGLAAETALTAARGWEQVGRASLDPTVRGRAPLNAAILFALAADSPRAQRALAHATAEAVTPAEAAHWRTLAPLLATPPRPAGRALTGLPPLSSGPLWRARAALASNDRAAALQALGPGAAAGVRAMLALGLMASLVLGILVGAAILALRFGGAISHTLERLPLQRPPPAPWGPGLALTAIGMTYLLLFALRDLPLPRQADWWVAVSAVALLVSTALVVGVILLGLGARPWEWSRLGWHWRGRDVGLGAAGVILLFPVIWGSTIISRLLFPTSQEVHPLIPQIIEADSLLIQLVIFLLAAGVAPLVEETLFRGLLLRGLARVLPFWPAAAISAVLFAVVHGQLVAILPITVLGLLFAGLTWYTGSVVAAATAHAVFNGVNTLLAILLAWALRGPG
jgi:membrane protease YdiL (CAAX protease family)